MRPDAGAHVAHHFDDAEQQYMAASLGMWLFLATEVLFFGGLFTGYAVYRFWYPAAFAEGSHHLDRWLGAINTAVLLGSSLTMALAVHAAQTNRQRVTAWFLIATIVLGGVFLAIKAYEYKHKYDENLVPGSRFGPRTDRIHYAPGDRPSQEGPAGYERTARERATAEADLAAGGTAPAPSGERGADPATTTAAIHTQADPPNVRPGNVEIFFSFYFAMTGLHAAHMVIGLGLLAALAGAARRGAFSAEYFTPVEMIGLYWHFVDIVWVFLFPLLYLIH